MTALVVLARHRVNAYTLEAHFEQNPANQFSVTDEVRTWLGEGRL